MSIPDPWHTTWSTEIYYSSSTAGIGGTALNIAVGGRSLNISTGWNSMLTLGTGNVSNQSGVVSIPWGSVGIGTSSPPGILEIRAAANENVLFRGHQDLASGPSIFAVNDANNLTVPLEIASTNVYFAGGFVGLGTTKAGTMLDVQNVQSGITYHGSPNSVAYFTLNPSYAGLGLGIHNGNVPYFDAVDGTGTSVGAFEFRTLNTTRISIARAGFVTFSNGHNDLAENYLVSGNVQRGSLVSIDQTQSKTVVLSSPSHSPITGVVSTAPGALMDEDGNFTIGPATKTIYSNEKAPIALVGTAPTLVTLQNGSIEIGDAIGISNIPGFGAKMVTAGNVVGRAIEKLNTNSCSDVSSIDSIVWPDDDGKNSLHPCFKLPDGTYVGKIMIAVAPSWYDPDVNLTGTGQVNVNYNIGPQILASLGYSGAKNEIEAATYQLFDTSNNPITRIGQYAKLAVAKITAGLISTENLIANNIIANTTKTKSLQTAIISPLSDITDTIVVDGKLAVKGIQTTSVTTDTLTANEATVSTLYANDIIGKNGSFSQVMTDKITALRDELRATIAGIGITAAESTPSALVADSANWTFDPGTTQVSLNGSFSLSDNLVVGSKLVVIGDSQFGNAFITGTFTAGEIAIKDNFIETTNSSLYIQPSGLGEVDIMNHTLVIADNGEVTINGNLTLNGALTAQTASVSGSLFGNLIAANEINTKKLTADVVNIATDSASTIIASSGFTDLATSSAQLSSNATAGTATLPAGKTELVIYNPKVTSSSMVYLTPVGSTNNQVVYLKAKFISPTPSPTGQPQSSFTIALDQPLYNDVNINWWIIN
jgi:hypothetical protein